MGKNLNGFEILLLMLVGVVVLGASGPKLLEKLQLEIVSLLQKFSVVVPRNESLVIIPGTDVGLDLGRIVVGLGFLFVVISVGLIFTRREDGGVS